MMNEYNTNAAPDTLQLNMEIISKELNDLIVTSEQEFGVTQQFSVAAVKTTAHSFIGPPVLKNNFQVPAYIANAFYGQQQVYAAHGLQNMKCNLNYSAVQLPVPQFGLIHNTAHNVTGTPNINKNKFCTDRYLSSSAINSTQVPHANATATPSYEFHYLRSRGENEKKFSASRSLSGQGAYRKITKLTHRDLNQKIQNNLADNEEVKFDLSVLDFLDNVKEKSIVRTLFDLLRDLHHAVAETLPSIELETDSQFVQTFAPSIKKSTMPSTLNVQNQVKQACRKLTIFTYEMQRILSANKMFDTELYAESEFYLNQLRQYLNQLEGYKRMVMEHKYGQFLREEVNVQAERLSILLEHTNRQIREVNARILAVDWYIGVKYRGDVHVAAQQLNNDSKNEEVSKKSKIGVINEILQLCNMKETTMSINSHNNTAEESTKTQTATAIQENAINSPIDLIKNQEVVNIKSFLYKNNDIFNAYKPGQATTSGHTRQPVFYIG